VRLAGLIVGLCVLGLVAVLGVGVFFGSSSGFSASAAAVDGSAGAICSTTGDARYTDAYGAARTLTSPQLAVVDSIVRTGRQLHTPQQGLVITLAAALQESTLHNYANTNVPASLTYPNDGVFHDHQSVGPFQQQVGLGWGTVAQLMKPDWQARQFLSRLVRVPNWQSMTETDAAQAVQRSAFGSLYQQWVRSARQILGAAEGISCSSLATAGPGGRQTVVATALHEVGTPYAWAGGNLAGPSRGLCVGGAAANDCNVVGFDCSGLTLFAYGKLGITLPHLASAQYNSGPHPDRSQLQPGDLLFLATERTDPATIHHVAMWIGNDSIVQAPESGQDVNVIAHPFAQAWFAGEFIGATRPLVQGAAT
jgi:hypothetical protein